MNVADSCGRYTRVSPCTSSIFRGALIISLMGARVTLIVAAAMLLASSSMAQTSAPDDNVAAPQVPSAAAEPAPATPPVQTPRDTTTPFAAMTAGDRVEWTVSGAIGLKSLTVIGPLAAGFSTWIDVPPEWKRSWEGFGKRYAEREADVAISNTIEAGLG